MKEFEKMITNLENETVNQQILIKNGKYPVLLTSVHSMNQVKSDGSIKLAESYTKGIVKYIGQKTNIHYFIKMFDNGIDSNHTDDDEFKRKLISYVKNNNIKLVIDIHGAKKERLFDVELGTLNNLSADYSTIMELKEAFEENGIINVSINNPFKGGKITQALFLETDIEVIQIEINGHYRDIGNPEKMYKLCTAITNFIIQYINVIK